MEYIYTAAYLLTQFRLQTLFKGSAVLYLGIKPTNPQLQAPVSIHYAALHDVHL